MANYRYVIYCHTNKINGMKYIGRTHLNPIHRWGRDGSGYDKRNVFGKDIEKYGWDNFTHEILEYGIVGKDNADEIERRYIKELNTIYPNGYNTEDGGIHGSKTPTKEKKVKRPKTGWKHSEETKRKMKESQRRYLYENPDRQVPQRRKPVDMYSKDGEFIKSFSGALEAEKETGISMSVICKVCKDKTGRYKSAGGYVWKYHKE